MDLKQLALVAVLTCAIVFGAGYKTAQVNEQRNAEAVIAAKTAEAPRDKKKEITVYVTGAVKKPGVYSMPDGSRIVEALNRAEPAADADLNNINLAELMKDEMPVYVPRKGDYESTGGGDKIAAKGGGNSSSNGNKTSKTGTGKISKSTTGLGERKVNLNTAGSGDLDQLKGIGPALAERIIEYRNEHGKFNNVSELKQVSGIGAKKFDEIKDKITI